MSFKKILIGLCLLFPLTSYAAANNNIDTHGSFNFHGGTLPINSETTITVDGVSYSIGQLITDINEATATIGNIGTQLSDIESTANTAYSVATTASTNAQNATNTANKAIPKSWIDVVTSSSITGVPSLNSSGYIHSPLDSSTIVHGPSTTLDGKTILNVLQAIDANKTNIATNTTNISTNTANITNNTARITANAANIATNTANIAKNTNDISTIQTTANNAIPLSQKGVANGVATLDVNSNVTAPILTPIMISTKDFRVLPVAGNNRPNSTASNAVQLPGYSMWYGNDIPLGSYGSGSGYVSVNDDWITPPETLHLGGQVEGSSGFLNVHCTPYAAANAGTCAQFMMGTPNIQGLAAGIGPNVSGIGSYGGFDAANIVAQVGGSTPLYVFTSNTASHVLPASSDNLDHTPTFTATGATFANPLPADASKWLVEHAQGIRLMTNEIGCQNCTIQTYAGGITGVTQNSDGLVTGITVASWNVPGAGGASGQIPGTSTTDGSTPALDTTWSNFGAPAIMVGIYTHAFNSYTLCELNGPTWSNTEGDVNTPSGSANNQLRTCEGQEMDLWNNDPVALRAEIHGLTLAYSTREHGSEPSYTSYDIDAAGANSISYAQSGEYWTIPFAGENFMVSSYDGTPYAAGSVKNVVQWRQSENTGFYADGGYQRNNIMPGIWTVRNVTGGCDDTTNDDCKLATGSSTDITTNIGVQVDWYGAANKGANGDPLWNSPTQEHIELNPKSSHGSIDLCANGQTDASCSLNVSSSSVAATQVLDINKGMYIPAGKVAPLTFATGSADSNNGSIQISYDLASNSLTFTNNHYGNTYNFNGGIITGNYTESLSTPASSTSTCTTGNFTDDANYHYVCVATNTWKRNKLDTFIPTTYTYATLPTSPNTSEHYFCTDCYSKLRESGDTQTGIEVNWNGSRWNDQVGIVAQH